MTAATVASDSPTIRPEDSGLWSESQSLSYRREQNPIHHGFTLVVSDRAVPSNLLLAVAQRLERLINLPPAWDGGRAKSVDPRAAINAVRVVAAIADDLSPVPHVFPLPSGGLQLEWLIDGHGLEIEVSSDGQLGALGIDGQGQVQVDEEFRPGSNRNALRATKSYLREISQALVPPGW